MKHKIDSNKIQLSLAFLIIIFVYLNYRFLTFLIPFFIIVSYYKIFSEKKITGVLILMMMSRTIMGFFIPSNNLSFDVLNLVCNYLPLFVFLIIGRRNDKTIKKTLWKYYGWTVLLAFTMIILCFYNLEYSMTEFPKEVLPLLLFVIALVRSNYLINIKEVIDFFRVVFIASVITYLMPNYVVTADLLFKNGIIFKESVSNIPIVYGGFFYKQLGFIFDWRIMGQFAILYLLLVIIKLKERAKWWDHALIIFILLSSFSRGPILMGVLIYLAVLIPIFMNLGPIKKVIYFIIPLSLVVIIAVNFVSTDPIILNYLSTFSIFNENNAISQRDNFSKYSIEKSKENPLFGLGIGALSSSKAHNKIDFGYGNEEMTEIVVYKQVSDAYWALSLGEKGFVVTFIFFMSCLEIFYKKKDFLFLFFFIGFCINLIGTDIPKQGMYYFVILIIMVNLNFKSIGKRMQSKGNNLNPHRFSHINALNNS